MRKILIVGGGYAGFYTAWRLEKKLRRGEAQVTIIDPRPYMTYQPFLPEVMAGSIEPRHAVVSLRSHLHRTEIMAGMVTAVDHANKKVTVRPATGPAFEFSYDIIVVTAGAVTRTFPIAGIAEQAIGLKHIEEAVAVRNGGCSPHLTKRRTYLPVGSESGCLRSHSSVADSPVWRASENFCR